MIGFSVLALVASLAVGIAHAEPTPLSDGDLQGRTFNWGGKGSKDNNKDSNGCVKDKEFYYSTRSCCLPHGGPPKTPTPPPGNQCPGTHYWHNNQGCCVPYHPNPPPQPSCPPKWGWQPGRQCCTPTPTPPSPPTPSKKPGNPGYPGGYHRQKRNVQWDATFCPNGLTTCPIMFNGLATGDSECIDTFSDITSCGGCASMKTGRDCSKISNAKSSTCHGGECVVEECVLGFKISEDETACVAA